MTVTKRDLIKHVSETLGMDQDDVAKIVDSALSAISQSLAQGKRWELRDFGVFEVQCRTSRQGRNPRTGEAAPVPERRVVTFRPGKRMREEISNGMARTTGSFSDRSARKDAPSSSLDEKNTLPVSEKSFASKGDNG